MKSNEIKVAEQLINLTEDHWFNPAVMARYMTEQPYYTLDRLMELVALIITDVSRKHGNNDTDGIESEGTYLANELSYAIKSIKETYEFKNLKLPKTKEELSAGMKKYHIKESTNTRYSWLDKNDDSIRVTFDHPFI